MVATTLHIIIEIMENRDENFLNITVSFVFFINTI